MTSEEFDEGMWRLCQFYGKNKKVNDDGTSWADEYWFGLKNYDDESMEDAVSEWVEDNRYFPTINQLKTILLRRSPTRTEFQDVDLTPDEEAFGGAALRLCFERFNGEITADEFKAGFKWAAIQHNVDGRIDFEMVRDPGGAASA